MMLSIRKGYLHLALESLRSSRMRSFMTMLGIIIGVMAVIVIVAIGQGVKEQIGNQANRYGSNILLVRPNQTSNGITGNGLPGGAGSLLTKDDMSTIQNVPGVQAVVPLSAILGAVKGDNKVDTPLVIATTPELGDILNHKIEYGGFFGANDGEHVAVLGSEIAKQIFNDNAPLGQQFTFRGQNFLVAGVFSEFPAAPFSLEANYNQAIFIPYETAESMMKSSPQVNQLFIKAKPGVDTTKLAESVHGALTSAHGGANDTLVLPPGAKGSSSDQTLHLLTLMTIGVAIVAFIVGGVGIMNMMLVSVTERIHEIGLRKAIGSTNHQILRQFVTEAFALCTIGAVLGFVFSLATIGLLRLYTSLEPVVVWPVALLVPLAALGIGVLFGTIPAIKASRMDPIEALRHE